MFAKQYPPSLNSSFCSPRQHQLKPNPIFVSLKQHQIHLDKSGTLRSIHLLLCIGQAVKTGIFLLPFASQSHCCCSPLPHLQLLLLLPGAVSDRGTCSRGLGVLGLLLTWVAAVRPQHLLPSSAGMQSKKCSSSVPNEPKPLFKLI